MLYRESRRKIVPDALSEQLAESPHYKGKTIEQKLFTYNPYKEYVRQVKWLMRQIED